MPRYIDADALLDHIPNLYERREVGRWVDEQPTAPVREVVLCRECKNFEPGEPPVEVGWCHAWSGATLEEAFCSFAERMEEA